ncbi:hypothetical protein EON81_09820 [bacterium]|nr:MAG: hypothetical protein EON81_09820 [bacterium]
MKRALGGALLAVLVVGCSGESSPTVGDAPITQGIQPRARVDETHKAGVAPLRPNTMRPADYARMRQEGKR